MRNKILVFISLLLVSLAIVGCSQKQPKIADLMTELDNNEVGKETYIIKDEKDSEKAEYNIEILKDKKDSDITVSLKDEDGDAKIEVKKRDNRMQIGMQSLLQYLTRGLSEENMGDISQYINSITEGSFLDFLSIDNSLGNIASDLSEFKNTIKKAYGEYTPINLKKENDKYVYKANNEKIREEINNFNKFVEENKNKIDKIYEELDSEKAEKYKKDFLEIKESLKKSKSIDFNGNGQQYKLIFKSEDGSEASIAYKFDKMEEVKLVDFKGKELTQEDIGRVLIPLMFSGALDNIATDSMGE